MKNLIIIGARNVGREIFSLAKQLVASGSTDWQIKGFLDDYPKALESYNSYSPILSSVEDYKLEADDVFISALGESVYREKYVSLLKDKGAEFINLIHPTVILSDGVQLGKGNVIFPQVHISNNVTIGDHTLILTNAILGHDVVFSDYTTAGAFVFLGGGAKIDYGAYVGTRSTILPNARVESFAYVGASSLVLKKVSYKTKVFGIPAKRIK